MSDAVATGLDGSLGPLRLRAARGVLRAYPLLRGRWRLASLLLHGNPGGRDLVGDGELLAGLADEEPLHCRSGLWFVGYRDRMYLEPFLFGSYEPANSRIFRRLVRAGDTVVDAGANFGWYTVLLARRVGESGRVIGFEPVPSLAGLADDAIHRNGVGAAARIERMALGAQSGRLTIYTFLGLPHGHASASNLGRTDATPHDCPVTTLDEYLRVRAIGSVDFMKLDVEGHELDVLRGARGLLSSDGAPIVAFEINPECIAHRGIATPEIEALLRGHGYEQLYAITPSGRLKPAAQIRPDGDQDYLALKHAHGARLRRAFTLRARRRSPIGARRSPYPSART